MKRVMTKICGVRTREALDACVRAGVDFIGFVFVDKSVRYITVDVASELSAAVPANVGCVGLFVDPDDALLESVIPHVRLDMIQLHGLETLERVADIRSRYNLPVMKAMPVACAEDVEAARAYEDVCDWLLFDAKPPKGGRGVTGGHGLSFDWSLLQGQKFSKPWMLAGGLAPENVVEAVSVLDMDGVDVSSGVESVRGVKDTGLIDDFLKKVAGCTPVLAG